ncbi:MAG: BatA domain-containing protein [bacterium]|nr:BatA domain-containing protein [bacterium]
MFGLSFFNPALLWGLGAAAIPILIHLYNRRRFRTVAWAAMEFLVSSSKLTARRLKLLQLLLLLTRMGIVSLLVVGVARPFLTGGFLGGPLGKSKTSAVIILDNSYSMGLREGNETVFDAAKKAAGEVVSSFRHGDSLTLILMGERPRVVTEGNPSPERVKKLIETSELSDEKTDILASLRKGLEVLDGEKNTQKELFLVTDCQQNGWSVANIAGWDSVDKLMQDAEVKHRIYVLDVSARPGENAMLSSVRLPAYPCGVGKRYIVEATAATTAEKPAGRPVFTLCLDKEGNEVARTEGSEFKDGTSTGRLIFSVGSPGFHWGKISIQPDRLEADNTRYFVVKAKDSVPVLCVDGVGSLDEFESGIAYMVYALAPEKGLEGVDDIANVLEPKVVNVEQLWEEELARYEVIVLSSVGVLSVRMHDALTDFVTQGGALMIFLGDKVDPLEYSERYASSAPPKAGFLPCALGSAKGTVPGADEKEAGGETVRISEVDFGHPAMAAFRDGAGGDVTTAKFYRYFPTSPDTMNPDIQVLARFSDGSPYIVERKLGRGKTILFTSSCDVKWSNMSLKPVFLPLVHRLAYYLVSGADERYNLTVGERMAVPLDAEEASSPAEIVTPPGGVFKVMASMPPLGSGVRDQGSGEEGGLQAEPFVSFEETSVSGIYTLNTAAVPGGGGTSAPGQPGLGEPARSGRVRYFALNVDTAESDVTALAQDGIRRLIRSGEMKYVQTETGTMERIEEMRHGKEIWRYFLVGVLCFLVVESLLARKIDKG